MPVSLSVIKPSLIVGRSSIAFTGTVGTSLPAQVFTLVSTGPTLTFTAQVSTESGGNWLSISSSSDSTPADVSVSVNTAGLPAGTYRGAITITSPAAGNSPQTVSVVLTLAPPPAIQLSSTALSFTARQGEANPPSQTLSVSNSGGGRLTFGAIVNTTSGGNWLSVSPSAGVAPATLTVAVNIAGLGPGTYSGTIQIADPGATNSPQTVSVTLTVQPPPPAVIALEPAALQFVTNVGGRPASQTFQVLNKGGGALGWNATVATQSGGNWLAVNPTTGVAPSTLTATVDAVSLPAGTYTGAITITALASANASNSPQVLPVTLLVGVPVIAVNGIVNGASFSPEGIVSPGSIASLSGVDLAARIAAAASLPLPTVLAGTQVLVSETAAPLFYVSPGQINFQVPAEIAATSVPVVVVSAGIRSAAAQLKLAPEAPGIFTVPPGGTGQGAVLNQDSSLNSGEKPADRNSVIQIFATGLGATEPALATGQPAAATPPFNTTVQKPVVWIGGVQAEVLFSAAAPGFVGLCQVNARVPAAAPAGAAVALQVQVGNRSSNTVTIAVR